jgi:Fe-S cluster biogenesis protein NfuA
MDIESKIKEVLGKIRPFLNSDGGDVEFVRYENGTVYVRLLGACSHCRHANTTLETTIEGALTSEIPEIIKVVNVNE